MYGSTIRKSILALLILTLFFLNPSYAQATVLFSDHFDSQPDWNMSQSAAPSGWSGKLGQNRGGSYEVGYISEAGRHGSTGKGFIQYWDKTTGYSYAQDSWLMKNNVNFPDEWYLGYWFQHDPNWNWASVASLKLLKVHFNDGSTWDIYWTNFCAGCTSYNVPSGAGFSLCTDEYGKNWAGSWNALGNEWHYFIWRFKHSTRTVELYIDGVNAMKTTYTPSFPGTGWDSSYGISIGGNITNGGGGVNEMWSKYDDIIMATTRTEVESFLGIDVPSDTIAPLMPSGVNIQILQ